MLQSILMMGGLGVAIGTALVIASKAFYVYEDPTVVAIDDCLPGANCGGCGYPGCTPNAEAIARGEQDVNSCVAAGEDVAMAIAEIMGVSMSEKEPEFAGSGCHYGNADAELNYVYKGVRDCRAASMLMGGMKVCRIGCLGLGTCVTACQFDALTIGEDHLPKVDQEKCTGCGACEAICPKNIIRLTSPSRRIMREYTKGDCTTPCQRACPSGIDIKEYIRLIREGDYHGSLQVIKERMPFPTVISRICPALCEFDCRRLIQDESVGINDLKRFVCDYEMNQDKRIQPYKAPATDKKIAIIGGGVQGLAAGYFSARLGHSPTIYEASGEMGGILRKAITRERLSMDVLDWDIKGIEDLGVEMKTHRRAGVNFTIPGLLKRGYDAVFTATGGWDARMSITGAGAAENTIPGTYLLIDLLRSKNDSSITIEHGDTVVIAGDSIKLPDAMEILKSSGTKKMIVLSRKHQEDSSFDQTAIDAMIKAGATIQYNSGITKLVGEDDKLTAIEYVDLASGESHIIETDTLVIASGRFPELAFVVPGASDADAIAADECVAEEDGEATAAVGSVDSAVAWEGVELQKKPDLLNASGLLSNQDVISEYPSAVAAINGGRRAATLIHHLMYGIALPDPERMITAKTLVQDVTTLNQVVTSPRNVLEIAKSREERKDRFSTGFSSQVADEESHRCLRCGLVCYEKA